MVLIIFLFLVIAFLLSGEWGGGIVGILFSSAIIC